MNKKYGLKALRKELGELTFGGALEAERLSEEMTLKEFAVILNISVQSLADLEKGRRIPSPARAQKIAKKLGEPEAFWIQLALQEKLRADNIHLKVTVA